MPHFVKGILRHLKPASLSEKVSIPIPNQGKEEWTLTSLQLGLMLKFFSHSFRWLDYPFHTFFPSTSNAVDLSSIINCHHPIIIYRSCSSFGQWFYVTRAISRIKFTEVRVHNIYYRKGNGQKKVYNGRRKQWKPKKEKEKLKKTPFVKKNSHRKYCP